MISVKLAQLPSHLPDSELHCTFNLDNEDENVEVPGNCFKQSKVVDFRVSLDELLSTIQCWGVQSIPNTAFEYLLNTKDYIGPTLLNEVVLAMWYEQICRPGVYGCKIRSLRCSWQLRKNRKYTSAVCLTAATFGHANCMRTAQKLGITHTLPVLQDACT